MSAASFSAATGKTQFLQLFVAQLQHQDPTEPVKQEQFLAQLAQFSTVEGVENLNAKFDKLIQLQETGKNNTFSELNTGASLLGTTVTHVKDGESRTAEVTEVQQKGGQVLLNVGGNLIPVSDITSVKLPFYADFVA